MHPNHNNNNSTRYFNKKQITFFRLRRTVLSLLTIWQHWFHESNDKDCENTDQPDRSRAVEHDSNVLVGNVDDLRVGDISELHDTPTSAGTGAVLSLQRTCKTQFHLIERTWQSNDTVT